MAGKVGWVVLVAAMALVTQLALVTWSIEEFPGGSGELTDPRGPRASGESGGTATAIPKIPGVPEAPGPGGDAAPRAGVPSNRVFQFRLAAEDHALFQTAVTFYLEQLYLVMWTLQRFVHPLFA
ncbi:hypothetical protein MG293_005453 [Ovis ammon polii]|uniref:Uncharacterized protein n=1 Tax=Ovis ammon polii TaxID=230172 RepID=A0AAD4YFC2_OVIAM|nr:hypothetical protein MG293_005453 [Ovis ammon polii]